MSERVKIVTTIDTSGWREAAESAADARRFFPAGTRGFLAGVSVPSQPSRIPFHALIELPDGYYAYIDAGQFRPLAPLEQLAECAE